MFGELCECGQPEPGMSYAVELDKEPLIILSFPSSVEVTSCYYSSILFVLPYYRSAKRLSLLKERCTNK